MSIKLNWLLQHTKPGAIVLQSWLSANGISPQLAAKYRASNWLEKLRPGVYSRAGQLPQWHDAVHCLATQLNTPVHLAGLTSLTYQGKAHYLKQHEDSIWLEMPADITLPQWFKEFPNNEIPLSDEPQTKKPLTNKPKIPQPKWTILKSNKLSNTDNSDLINLDVNGLNLKASNQELAAFELLNAVPKLISFEHAAELFQGLVNLSPKRVQSLLNRSASIRTNRIFLFLAHFYDHPWATRLDENSVNLGAGKRKVVDNGKFDSRYQITVPYSFMRYQQNDNHTERFSPNTSNE